MIHARITGTGSYAPKKIITNHDLEKLVDTSDEWIIERTGIKERRIAEKGQSTSDLAYEAGKKALKAAGLAPEELDLIIVATMTPDKILPSTACMLQEKLGAKKAAAFDIYAACSGFIYGMSVANAFIRSEMYKNVLSRRRGDPVAVHRLGGPHHLHPLRGRRRRRGHPAAQRETGHSLDAPAFRRFLRRSDPGSGRRRSASLLHMIRSARRMHFIKMKGNETFKAAVRSLEGVVQEALEHNKVKPEEIDFLVPHQANFRIIQAMAQRLNMPMEKVVLTLPKYGNTSAASIPMALDEAVRDGRIKENHLLLFEAFGGGLTWASALVRW